MGFDASFLSPRAKRLAPSGIRKFFDLAAKLPNAINLSLGQADFDVPQPIKEAAIRAIREGDNRYTQTGGLEPLKERCWQHLEATQGIKRSETDDEIIITGGASGGLLLSYLCLLDEGDEVLVPDPYFIEYLGQASMVGATAVFYDTFPRFRLEVEKLEAVRTEKTKAIIINSPQNPTGTMYTEAELKAVAEWARQHGIFVISDEIYELFTYDRPHISIKRFYPEGTALVSAFSKTYGMPGWRIGYTVLPQWMMDKALVMQSYSFVCAPTPFQHAVLEAFDVDMSGYIDEYRKKRDLIYEGVREYYPCEAPPGSFYIFPEIPEALREEFEAKILEKQLLVVPGTAFSPRSLSHFRISFGAADDNLKRGIDLLREIAEGR